MAHLEKAGGVHQNFPSKSSPCCLHHPGVNPTLVPVDDVLVSLRSFRAHVAGETNAATSNICMVGPRIHVWYVYLQMDGCFFDFY